MKNFWRLIGRREWAAVFGIILSFILGNAAIFGQQCEALRGNVIRLHILANSDSEMDQAVKIKVRDAILSDTGELFSKAATRGSAQEAAQKALPEMEQTASRVLKENGFEGTAHAEFCNMYFNTRNYGEYTLPAGMYDAVRITLGAGKGHNWWCVIYPPICVPAAGVKDSETLEEIRELDRQPLLTPKLAIVEAFEKIKEAFTGE